jgi:hypothetical protein
MEEIERLRAEIKQLVDWIMGDRDALSCLQAIYNNPAAAEGSRIKAAAAAIAFERPKLTVRVQMAGPALLGDRLDGARAIKVINPEPELLPPSQP